MNNSTPVVAGSKPLKSIKYEIYAQQRVLNCPPEQAAQRAGYPPRCGRHSKIERRPDVQARMAWLRREDDDLIRRKRENIEASLLAVVNADVTDFAVIEDGKIVKFDWDRIRDGLQIYSGAVPWRHSPASASLATGRTHYQSALRA